MKTYLISFTSPKYPSVNRKQILDLLDTQIIIKNWYGIMPYAILVSCEDDISSTDISKVIGGRFPSNLTFLVTETTSADGLANKEVWDFINKPKSSGRWK
jgi:hypothetical protein